MARASKTGGKKAKAEARKASPAKGRKAAKTKRGVGYKQRKARSVEAQLTRKTRELHDALAQQIATAEVLQVISDSSGDLALVFDTMLDKAMHLCGAQFGVLATYDGKTFRTAATRGLPEKYAAHRVRSTGDYGPGTAPFRHLQGELVVHIVDLMDSDAYRAGEPNRRALVDLAGARCLLCVPLLSDRRVIGCVMIFRQQARSFSDRQIALLKYFAAQAAIAIENARLFNETKEALQRQTATADILKVIASSPSDVQPVFEAIVQTAVKLFGCETAFIQRCDENSFWSVARCRREGLLTVVDPRPGPIDPAANFPSRAIRSKRTLSLPDWSEIDLPDFEQRIQRELGYNCAVYLPLLYEDECLGVLGIAGSRPHMFTEADIALGEAFRDQAVIAIRNTQLFDEVQQRTRELSKSLDDLRAAQDRLVQTEKLASLGQLTAGIAHEIKNPLNFVNNFSALSAELVDEMTDVFENPALDEAGRRKELNEIRELLKGNLEKVVQHGKRADSIVKNMLLHSREGSGERRSADINALVEESLNLAYHGARAEKPGFVVMLKHDLDPDAGALDLYPQEITRALMNLISNGFYAAIGRKAETDDSFEPTLSAATRNLGDTVEIRIRDNGTGIPPDVREKMFNPFFTTKPTGEGTGLGLSMTHDIIVKQHGGRIDMETELGEFTEFIITLPRGKVGTPG